MANYNSQFTGQEIDNSVNLFTLSEEQIIDLGVNTNAETPITYDFLLKLSITAASGNIKEQSFSWVPISAITQSSSEE